MRAIVDAGAFSEALNHVRKVIQRSAIPILEGVLVRFKNGRCFLTASDFTTWLTVALPARGEEFAFVFQKPQEVAKACRYYQGELTLEVHDIKSDYPTVTFRSGHRSGTFDAFPEKDYPLPPPVEENVSFTANAAALLKRIERVKYAVRDPQGIYDEPQRTCVQFSGNDVFCVDGHRAACDTDTALAFPRPFLTWGNSLAFLKLMGGTEAAVRIGTNHIWFSTGAVSICAHREGLWCLISTSVPLNSSLLRKHRLHESDVAHTYANGAGVFYGSDDGDDKIVSPKIQQRLQNHNGNFGIGNLHMGIMWEERRRAKESKQTLFKNQYPLVKMGWTRSDCYTYNKAIWGLETKASCCVFCPFHTNYFYYYIQKHEPYCYACALQVDELVETHQARPPIKSKGRIFNPALVRQSICSIEMINPNTLPTWIM